MVTLHRINKQQVVVNAAHIVLLESTPDTMITLTTGEKILLADSPEEVIEKVTDFLRRLGRGPILVGGLTKQL